MSVKVEEVEVRYCDFCGQREDSAHSVLQCWRCGKDCCPQHYHLVLVEGGITKMVTYLCTSDRDYLADKLRGLFQDFSMDRAGREAEKHGKEANFQG